MVRRHTLSLVKENERFLIRYYDGQESEVLAWLVSQADDPRTSMDWLDAAVLSFQMGRGQSQPSPTPAG
jgi:hypothetical protein